MLNIPVAFYTLYKLFIKELNKPSYFQATEQIPVITRMGEFSRLKDYTQGGNILSLGVSTGLESVALQKLFPESTVIGIDLSKEALLHAKRRLDTPLVLATATELPFQDNSIDAVVASSVMHEVYSYGEGMVSFDQALKEQARVLKAGGVLFLRDSRMPQIQKVTIGLQTTLAKNFYDYFRIAFRSDVPPFPCRYLKNMLTLSAHQASEFLFHFVNFEMGYPHDPNIIGNTAWKELQETYYPEGLQQDDYVAHVQEISGLRCVENSVSERPRMAKPIEANFTLTQPISLFTKKMELLFIK